VKVKTIMSGRSSVQDVVRVIITRNPYLYRGLRMRVVNYSALARYIQGEVESAFGNDVDPNTIVTAIMRLSNQVLEPEEPRSPLSGGRINLVTGVSEVFIPAPPVRQTEIVKRLAAVGVFDSYSVSLHQTRLGVRFLTNAPDAGRIVGELGEFAAEIHGGFAELHVGLPPQLEGVEGMLTLVVDVLAQNGVHAVDISLSGGELSVVLREDEASRAFEAMRGLAR